MGVIAVADAVKPTSFQAVSELKAMGLETVLLTCGTSFLINLFFAFLTNKVQMVESLKSVE